MIIELLVMKLTLDAIMQHCNTLGQEQEMRMEISQLRQRLVKFMNDYEAGAIDQATYSKKEAEIMASLSVLTQKINAQKGPQSFDTGIGL